MHGSFWMRSRSNVGVDRCREREIKGKETKKDTKKDGRKRENADRKISDVQSTFPPTGLCRRDRRRESSNPSFLGKHRRQILKGEMPCPPSRKKKGTTQR